MLFYSAIAVFLIASYAIILYVQGYKYSFSEDRFFRTGAIYLKTNTGADVYLDDKLPGNTSFFNNSYRLEGLLPGRYTIRVQKNNYSTWQKQVIVDEGFVSEFSKILLLPKAGEELEDLDKEIALTLSQPSSVASPSIAFVLKKGALSALSQELIDKNQNKNRLEKIADNVKGFEISEDKNKLVWWTANEVWVMWLGDANYQPYHKTGDKELITRYSIPIKKAAWFRDNDHLLVDTGYFNIIEIDTRGGINIVTL